MLVEVVVRVEAELEPFPNLFGYLNLARSRPAFMRAFAAQKAVADAAGEPLKIVSASRHSSPCSSSGFFC
jgi:hypothetical protein